MKTITTLIVLLVCIATPVSAFEFDAPTKNDKKLMTLATMTMIDYQQSVNMFYKSDGHHELNPTLGTNPERKDLMMSGLAGMALAYSINVITPEGKFKDFLLDSMLATERFNIEENQRAMNTGKRTFECIMLVMAVDF